MIRGVPRARPLIDLGQCVSTENGNNFRALRRDRDGTRASGRCRHQSPSRARNLSLDSPKLKFPGRKDKNLNRFKQIAQN